MLGFLTLVRNKVRYPLADAAAAQSFWRALPKDDTIAAQRAICRVLAAPVPRGFPSANRLQALLLLDQCARTLVDALPVSQGGANSPVVAATYPNWQAEFEVCRSFCRAYREFLRSIRDNKEFEDRRDYRALVLLRYFRRRQRELLLRPFSDGRAPAFSWRETHAAYALAQSCGLHQETLPIKLNHPPWAVEVRLERDYVNVLMQDLMSSGQFPPFEASWVSQRLPRWSLAMTLKTDEGAAGAYRFVLDPRSDAGLVRSNSEPAEGTLCLDMTPVLKSLSAHITSQRDVMDRPGEGVELSRARQLKLVQKVSALCSAEPRPISPRAERRPVAAIVEVAVGLPEVLQRIRNKPPEEEIAAPPRPTRRGEGVTITGFGPATGQGAVTLMQSSSGAPLLTMVNQSDSGCRLHGVAFVANPVLPGTLIAFREDAAYPWSLAVVRRVKWRFGGSRVEIGAEYLGIGPRWVVIEVSDSDSRPGKEAERESRRFDGLYLRESNEHPLLPMKTLVLPACGLSPGDRLSVRSRKSVHTVRLKEPLEDQADFIRSPFEILDHKLTDEPVSSHATSEEA
jgi:hypothetical protein